MKVMAESEIHDPQYFPHTSSPAEVGHIKHLIEGCANRMATP